ncbi:MAG TPA: ImmA/IrrE family metallo-endopeptidase [Candidatus Eremiobacteraceae bacterium]|nr:ImmA/IrrE family metallo-endopeptidase [Candidatus Eremiobacteraceae bacterium]
MPSRIERIAEKTLAACGIGKPPVDLRKITRHLGLAVQKDSLPPEISGFFYRKGTHNIIGVNKKHVPARRRFTVAHEIGHYILGHAHDEVHVDRNFGFIFRDERSSRGVSKEEIEANAFAAALLMPAKFLMKDLSTNAFDLVDSAVVSRLAHRYGVSVQALSIRLGALGRS